MAKKVKKSQKRGLYYRRNLTENLKKFTPRKFIFWNFRSNCAYNGDVFQGSKNTTTTNIIPYNTGQNFQKRGLCYRRNLTDNFKKNTFWGVEHFPSFGGGRGHFPYYYIKNTKNLPKISRKIVNLFQKYTIISTKYGFTTKKYNWKSYRQILLKFGKIRHKFWPTSPKLIHRFSWYLWFLFKITLLRYQKILQRPCN